MHSEKVQHNKEEKVQELPQKYEKYQREQTTTK